MQSDGSVLVPFQLLDLFELRFDFSKRFSVMLSDGCRLAAEESFVCLDL